MGVSINTSNTAQTRTALAQSIKDSAAAATALSTGQGIIPEQDPTGYAVGSNMQRSSDVLGVIATGITQSKAMLDIALNGILEITNNANELNKIAASAKRGFMTDPLIGQTLAPSFAAFYQEISRIAGSTEFNGQHLLDGTASGSMPAVAAEVSAKPTGGDFTNAVINFPVTSITDGLHFDALSANINGSNTPQSVDLHTFADNQAATISLSGGKSYMDSAGKLTITGATLYIKNATLQDQSGNNFNDTILDATISNVTVEIAQSELDKYTTTTLDYKNTVMTTSTNSIITFSNFKDKGGTRDAVTSISATTIAKNNSPAPVNITNITTRYDRINGEMGYSTFDFVTGRDFSAIKVQFPDIMNAFKALNTANNISTAALSELPNLTTEENADIIIPLLSAFIDQLTASTSQIAAYQRRFEGISSQLSTYIEGTNNAAGAVMDTDLPKATESLAKAISGIGIGIASMQQILSILGKLERLVSGG